MESANASDATAIVRRLVQATNDHDLARLVDCFAEDYRNETPAHPSRGFTGREQVKKNWEQIFAFVPDISAKLVRCADDGNTAWSEWEMRGTRRDGSLHLMRGVIIWQVQNGRAQSARFYLEPVVETNEHVDQAVLRAVAP